jgi:hypothetical protein
VSFQEAATDGLREALRSFGCHFTGKANESADVPVESSVLKTSLQMDKHDLTRAGRMYFLFSTFRCRPGCSVIH